MRVDGIELSPAMVQQLRRRFGPISCRLAWPTKLDLMARLAGLRLIERWGGWHRQPYTGRGQHVSVYTWR